MSDELATETSASVSGLPLRAVIAMLTLQLRAAQQEALAAERAAENVESDGAVVQLRARLGALLDDRRAALDAEVARARDDAALTVAAAHRAARVMTSRSTTAARQAGKPAAALVRALVDSPAEATQAPPSSSEPASDADAAQVVEAAVEMAPIAAASPVGVSEELLVSSEPAVDAPAAHAAEPAAAVIPTLWASLADVTETAPVSRDRAAETAVPLPAQDAEAPTIGASAPSHGSVVAFDAEQMATVFASVLATMLDERMSRWVPAPAPRKPSFFSQVFHPDVVLVGIIMIVSMIVVAAWMS